MRALFSIAALLVALVIAMKLVSHETAALVPAAASAPGQRAAQTAALVQQAIEQGAAARASEAAAQ